MSVAISSTQGVASSLPLPGIPAGIAWQLFHDGAAQLVDVRSVEELKLDGVIPGAHNVPWLIGPAQLKNVRFIRELEKKLGGKQQPVIFICRGGVRAINALEAARKAGFTQVSYVLAGIDGQADGVSNWRNAGLPLLANAA
jgi:Rhodanese-related sulfurtransferase